VARPGPVDWSVPWLAPYRACGERVAQRWLDGRPLHDALDAESRPDTPRFVADSELAPGTAYEQHVAVHGAVPTRPNLHDFFNGLVWLVHTPLKRRLNALQSEAITRDGVGAVRGPLRDAVTLLDENGALLRAPAPLWAALRERDWPRLFITLRPLWAEAELQLVGHALLEKLQLPRKPITAHLLPADLPLDADTLASKPFCPLPVLGVPGWWPANETPGFYDDATVFRPPR
jgi:hypothetical protein